jgi:glycosyltransferase involved in cell wall biosynthesis
MPRPVRARLRSVAAWSDRLRPAPLIEDWSTPLIATDKAATSHDGRRKATAAVAGPDVVSPDQFRSVGVTAGEHIVRCLFVTVAMDVGGLDEVVAFLARRLPAYGICTAVLHPRSDPSATGEPSGRLGRMLRLSGIEVHEVHVDDDVGAEQWISSWRPAVISAHGDLPDWVLDVAQRIGVPYIDTLHGMHSLYLRGQDWNADARRSARLSALVTVSDVVRMQYLSRNPQFAADRIVTIPNGVDDQRRSPADRRPARRRLGLTSEYLFVSLSRHSLIKNTFGLIAAFGQLARERPEAHLVVAGRPDDVRYFRHVQQLQASLASRGRIHLRDNAPSPAELLAAADGFVLDSFAEGGPLVSMEALCAGVPIILSDVGAAREQIGGDSARGYVVANPLGDPLDVDWEAIGTVARSTEQPNRDEFAEAMDSLVSDRSVYLQNRTNLATESAARFSADVCLSRHAVVLKAVASGTKLPAFDAPYSPIEQ